MEQLKKQVLEANLALPRHGLALFTWGNVSAIDRQRGVVVIKPSGVAYQTMSVDDYGCGGYVRQRGAGSLAPFVGYSHASGVDRCWPSLGGVAHTHSTTHATAWAQAGMAIPALGTTHADYFSGDIPCTRPLTRQETGRDYELNTGKVIVETLADTAPLSRPGVVVYQHGPFAWGKDAHDAAHNAVVLEEVAHMAWIALTINPQLRPIDSWLMDKHFMRKHGPNAYYGQK